MNFSGTLLAVRDMEKAKEFYQQVLEQTIVLDLGAHVSFENGLSLQADYEAMINLSPEEIIRKSNSFQLYFDVEDLDKWIKKFDQRKDIKYLHKAKEYPWKQRSLRIYDRDDNIIEIAENMDTVIRRLLKENLTAEEISKATMYPIEYIKSLNEA